MTVLRPLTLEDLPCLTLWRNDRQLRNATQGFRFPITAGMDQEWFRANVEKGPPGKAIFAIQTNEGTLAGLAQLVNIDMVHRHAELGLFIGVQSERGKGLGKLAVQALLVFGFQDLNLRRIHLQVAEDNAPAIALYETMGFTREGYLRQHYFHNGRYVDVILFGRFRDPG